MTLAALALVLCGCSTLRLGYSQGARLGTWWVDRYLDLDDSQGRQVRAALDQWLVVHRQGAVAGLGLAGDVALLEQAAQEARHEVTPEQVCGWWQKLEQRRDAYLQPLVPAIAELLPTLTPSQLRHLEARFARNDATWREEQLPRDPRQREQAAIDRVQERVESVYGRLDRGQRDFLAEQMRRSPWDAERWLIERQARQRDTLESFAQLGNPALSPRQRQELVQAWLLRVTQPASEAQKSQRQALMAYQCRFLAELHRRTTPAQRERAADKLLGWAADLRSFVPVAAGVTGAVSASGRVAP